jgi:phosphoglucomutase
LFCFVHEYLVDNIRLILQIDLSTIGSYAFGGFTVEVISALDDYVALMKQIFDFDAIRRLLAYPNFNCLFDSLNGGVKLMLR